MADEKFDAIVVGGGPGGLTEGYGMAKAGMQVIVVERGDYCGAKNVFGGIFFTNVLKEIMPDFLKDAPVERNVTKRRFALLTPGGEMGGDFKFDKFNKDFSNNSFTVRSEEHTSELQSRQYLVCRLLLEKKKNKI